MIVATVWALRATRVAVVTVCATMLGACSDGGTGPLDQLPRDLTLAEQQVIASANAFGLDMFRRLVAAQSDENVFFSPLSAYLALGMTANGAAGETLDAMRGTLQQSMLTEEEANNAYRGLLDLLLGLDSRVQFDIGNSIWYRLGLSVRPEFVEQSRSVFDAEVAELDFSDPSASSTINRWVEDRTNGRIKDLVSELSSADVMLLINAIYFKGSWQDAFNPQRTQDLDFQLLDGSFVDAPMMTRSDVEILRHQQTNEFEAAELLYGRGAYVMTIVLPNEGTSPADLMTTVDAATWAGWMDGFEDVGRLGDVQLPRFRLEWGKALNDELIDMGMGIAFEGADFSRLAAGGEAFFISEVRQKAFVEVNEEGTEAAAATSVNIADSGPSGFLATRPFVFAIRERFSGTILFLGQLVDPTAS